MQPPRTSIENETPEPRRLRRSIPLLALLLLAPGLFVLPWRLASLADTNPGVDHAHFSLWVQETNRATHWWPRGEGFRHSLEADRDSSLHQVFRRVYNQPYRLFNLSNLATFGTLSLAFGDSFGGLVKISIVASIAAAVFLVLSSLSLISLGEGVARSTHIRAAVATSAFVFLSSYLHVFSAQGWHNVAICYVVLHFLVANHFISTLKNSVGHPPWSLLAAFVLTFALASFSYFVLPWLVGPAFLAQLIVTRGVRDKRAILVYVGMVIAVMAPAVLVIFLLWQQAAPNVEQAQFQLSGAVQRAVDWFLRGAAIFSAPGFAGALFGLAWMATKRMVFPAVFVLGVFLLSFTSYQIGEETWLRSFAYAIPFCVIGLSYAAALGLGALRTLASRRSLWTAISAVVLLTCSASYLVVQIRTFESQTYLCDRLPRYCEEYLIGRELVDIIGDIDTALPAGSSLTSDGNAVMDMYRVLTERRDVAILPPLDSMSGHLENGTLDAYVARHAELSAPKGRVFLLSRHADVVDVAASATSVFGKAGLAWTSAPVALDEVGAWDTESVTYQVLRLHRVALGPRQDPHRELPTEPVAGSGVRRGAKGPSNGR